MYFFLGEFRTLRTIQLLADATPKTYKCAATRTRFVNLRKAFRKSQSSETAQTYAKLTRQSVVTSFLRRTNTFVVIRAWKSVRIHCTATKLLFLRTVSRDRVDGFRRNERSICALSSALIMFAQFGHISSFVIQCDIAYMIVTVKLVMLQNKLFIDLAWN